MVAWKEKMIKIHGPYTSAADHDFVIYTWKRDDQVIATVFVHAGVDHTATIRVSNTERECGATCVVSETANCIEGCLIELGLL